MTVVLDRPLIDVTLDFSELGESAKCARCEGDAEYRVTDSCCNRAMNVCGSHEASLNAKWSMQIILDGSMACTRCPRPIRTRRRRRHRQPHLMDQAGGSQ